MAIADTSDVLIAAHVESASRHEVKLVEDTIDNGFTENAPDKIIGDKAYDSDSLAEQWLEECDIELIAPHKWIKKSDELKMDENFVVGFIPILDRPIGPEFRF